MAKRTNRVAVGLVVPGSAELRPSTQEQEGVRCGYG